MTKTEQRLKTQMRQLLSNIAYVARQADEVDLIHLSKKDQKTLFDAFDILYQAAEKYI